MNHDQIAAIQTVATFIGGAKDRLGRPDPAANDTMREARQQVLELAQKYGVAAGHATYLDQCAALLRAISAPGVQPPDECHNVKGNPRDGYYCDECGSGPCTRGVQEDRRG